MTIRILFWAFLAVAVASPFLPPGHSALGASIVLGIAWFAGGVATLIESAERKLAARVEALEAKPDASAQLEALSLKIHDPTNGLAEQIRQLRNLAAFKR